MKIGIFGGLFDPPHIGHLIIAQHVLEEFHLDRILFVPSGHPPHKSNYSPYADRYEMTRLAVAGNEQFVMSDIEKMISETTYTIETIRALNKDTNDELYLMIGSDQWLEIETWKEPEELFRECRIIVMRRQHHDIMKDSRFFDRIMVSTAPLVDVSSTMIRARIQKGLSVRYLVEPAVSDYIIQRELYKT